MLLSVKLFLCWSFCKSLTVRQFVDVVKLSKILSCFSTIAVLRQTEQVSILLYFDSIPSSIALTL